MEAADQPDEAQVETAPRELSLVDQLADFIDAKAASSDLTAEACRELAAAVLEQFFRVDDSRTIYAVSGVDAQTLAPFASVHWGALRGRMRPDELRALGGAFIETAEAAELEASMARWLLRDANATNESVGRIVGSFRLFRAELDATDTDPEHVG